MTALTPDQLAHVQFVLARVLADIAANPSMHPLLGSTPPKPLAKTCRRGHADWAYQSGERYCATCRRQRRAAGMGRGGR